MQIAHLKIQNFRGIREGAIRFGNHCVLIGPNNCGKSTILRMVAGFEEPTGGRIFFDKRDITTEPPNRRGIGFVFQNYALFRHMTVANNIAFGLDVMKRSRRPDKVTIKARVEELLELVQLPGYGSRYPAQLSGGQRQRVALARALACEPKILLLDEPFGALDAKVRRELRNALREIHDRVGLTSIFVTHDYEEAFALADKVAILGHGKIEQYDTPEAVKTRPASDYVREFLS